MNVFISHATQDRDYVSTLAKALDKAGLSVWEADVLQAGENWGLKAGKALEQADVVIVVLSPESVSSEWVRKEIEFAISSPRLKGCVIPILRRPTPGVPWILRELPQWMEEENPTIAAKAIASALQPSGMRGALKGELAVGGSRKRRFLEVVGRYNPPNPKAGPKIKIPAKAVLKVRIPKTATVASSKK